MKAIARVPLAVVAILVCAGCGHSGGPVASAQVVGTVTAGPTCPVEQINSPCPDRPVAGALVQALRDGRAVEETHSDAGGAFRLAVAPGAYTIVATNAGGYASTARREVSVSAGQSTTVDLVVDTGIR